MVGIPGSQSDGPSKFQFINAGNTASLENDSKARVRAHAMRDFHRRKLKQEMSDQEDVPPSGVSMAPDQHEQTHKFRLGPWGLQQRPSRTRAPRQKRPVPSSSTKTEAPGRALTQQRESSNNSHIGTLRPLASKPEPSAHPPTAYTSLALAQRHLSDPENSASGIPSVIDEADAALLADWGEPFDSFDTQTLHSDIGSGSRDPFDSIPYLSSQPLQNLLHYTSSHVKQPSIMTSLRQSWLHMATKDPTFCYAVLCQYSKQFAAMQQEGVADPLPCISEVIEMVNARLGDPELATCDGTIGAVASIANYEDSNT